mgnify:CR=1 FL=1
MYDQFSELNIWEDAFDTDVKNLFLKFEQILLRGLRKKICIDAVELIQISLRIPLISCLFDCIDKLNKFMYFEIEICLLSSLSLIFEGSTLTQQWL